jgi:hypothetical protein
MRWPSRKTTPWKRKVAWLPFTLGEVSLWLEPYETRKRNGVREYRIPGEPTIYLDFYA